MTKEKTITIFKKEIKWSSILFYLVFLFFFIVMNFILEPIIGRQYPSEEIKYFKENEAWKIMALIIGSIFLFLFFFKAEGIEQKGNLFLGFLFLSVFSFVFFTNHITSIALYINQLDVKEKEVSAYLVLNEDVRGEKFISLLGEKESISNFDDIFESIENTRNQKGLVSIQNLKNRDTIHIVYKKGLFGYSYIK